MLGDVLALCQRSAGEALVRLPPALGDRIDAAAAAEGLSSAQLLRRAVATFTDEAQPSDWSTLMSRLRDNSDPAAACLTYMTEYWLRGGRSVAPPQLGDHSHD